MTVDFGDIATRLRAIEAELEPVRHIKKVTTAQHYIRSAIVNMEHLDKLASSMAKN